MSQNSTRRWAIEAYEHSIRIDGPARDRNSTTPPARENGDIQSFSADSRRRLIKKFLRLERSRLSAGSFVTLTYHEDWTTEREDIQQDLNAFLQALRRAYPEACYLWRLEFQSRGAPHFHLMIWGPASGDPYDLDELRQWVRKTWTRIADQDSAAHAEWGTDTRRLTSWREAMAYVSKYVAAAGNEGDVEYSGRRWGAAQSLPTTPTARFHVSESDAHIIRRICRKLLAKRLGEEHPLVEHLKTGRKALIGLNPSTWMDLLDYIQDHGEQSIRAGPLPDAGGGLDEDEEWVMFTAKPAPSTASRPHPATRVQCA